MHITRQMVIFDAPDLTVESSFWAGLMDVTVDSLGARLLQGADADDPEGFRVYADPAGHPFCLRWG